VARRDADAVNSDKADAPDRLAELRDVYEPYLHALSRRLLMTLPPWIHKNRVKDNWQGGPWIAPSRRGRWNIRDVRLRITSDRHECHGPKYVLPLKIHVVTGNEPR